MNENEQVLETFIKQQQGMINDLSQQNIMLNTKIKYLEEKLQDFDKYDAIIKDLKRDKVRLERKVESLTNNNKSLGDRIRNGKDELKKLQKVLEQNELKKLQKVLEQKKLINKTSISGFSHTGKIQRN
jgi:predicted RNase H-like nuclease (RuvC/YqgF family)